jgi:glycosyltransferase involved in cell wall biosynthesis
MFFAPTTRRGLWAAPLKYPRQFMSTLAALVRARPRVVFVQSPPSFAAWTVALYAWLARTPFVIDAHSDAFDRAIWTTPSWLNALVYRRAAIVVVTNDYWAKRVLRMGGRPLVVPAVPISLDVAAPPPLDGPSIAVVTTWARDEPIDAVVNAARLCPDVSFYLTGKPQAAGNAHRFPPNVHLTGFLAERTYNGLLANVQAVICLTTRDNTMQNGAAEALYLGTPIITSDWAVLRQYFSLGTVHVDNSPEAIAAAVRRVIRNGEHYRVQIRSLKEERTRDWHEQKATISRVLAA